MSTRREFIAGLAAIPLAGLAPASPSLITPRCSHCGRVPAMFTATIWPGLVALKCTACPAVNFLDSGMPWLRVPRGEPCPRLTPWREAAERNIGRLGRASETARFLRAISPFTGD